MAVTQVCIIDNEYMALGTAVIFSSSYQIWDLLLGCDDSDVVRNTVDFIMFVIKDEAVREQLSKDCALVEAVRNLTTQMNDNCKQFHFDVAWQGAFSFT